MADFSTPFGVNGPRRLPTSDEKANGFPCGAADQLLFNQLIYRIEAELGHLITYAGLTGSDAVNTRVREAVEELIISATGSGDPSAYLTLAQARTRLPIFPHVQTATFKFTLSSPADGTVRVPAGTTFMHRGIYPVTSAQTDLSTSPSKTYHVRWNPDDGFTIHDLANLTYNPTALAESDTAFDSTYDDMLVARVTTNSSNVATITNLANKSALTFNGVVAGTDLQLSGANGANVLLNKTLDWSRAPANLVLTPVRILRTEALSSNYTDMSIFNPSGITRTNAVAVGGAAVSIAATRYGLARAIMYDGATSISVLMDARA